MSATQRGSVLLGMIIGASLALGYTELSVRFGSTARLFQTTGDRIPAVDDPRRAVRRASVGGTVSREAKANRLATPAVAVEDEAWVRMRLTRGDIEEWLGSTPETEGWSGSYAKPHDGTKLMVQPWGDRKREPPFDNSYFNKNADLVTRIKELELATGLNVYGNKDFPLTPLPGRLFSIIDLYDWNKTWGFLDCKKHLSLYPIDLEINLTTRQCQDSSTQYVYGDRENEDHWGDIHFPIKATGAGTFDLVTFSQTLEHLYDPVLALRNIFTSLAPGGYMFTSVPMMNHVHMQPFFYSMPTTWGLAVWCKTAGFEVLKVGQFGNEQELSNMYKSPTWWPKTHSYFNETRRPQIINDPWVPIDVWVLARRPLWKL